VCVCVRANVPRQIFAQLPLSLSPAPTITSVVCGDGSNSPGLAADDFCSITFSAATQTQGLQNKIKVDGLLSITPSFCSVYSGQWTTANTVLKITCDNAGSGALRLKPAVHELSFQFIDALRNAAATSSAVSSASYTPTGFWG